MKEIFVWKFVKHCENIVHHCAILICDIVGCSKMPKIEAETMPSVMQYHGIFVRFLQIYNFMGCKFYPSNEIAE